MLVYLRFDIYFGLHSGKKTRLNLPGIEERANLESIEGGERRQQLGSLTSYPYRLRNT